MSIDSRAQPSIRPTLEAQVPTLDTLLTLDDGLGQPEYRAWIERQKAKRVAARAFAALRGEQG